MDGMDGNDGQDGRGGLNGMDGTWWSTGKSRISNSSRNSVMMRLRSLMMKPPVCSSLNTCTVTAVTERETSVALLVLRMLAFLDGVDAAVVWWGRGSGGGGAEVVEGMRQR